jgi:hypothetical protein
MMPLPMPVSTGTSSKDPQCPVTTNSSSPAVHAPTAHRINTA